MNLLLLSGIISFLALDTTIAFQMLISSPLLACPILGWLLGDLKLGLELGFLFQLLWLGRIPAGAVTVPEGNLASMTSAALVLLYRDIGFSNSLLAVAFVEGILISYLGALVTLYYRKINSFLFNLSLLEVERLHYRVLPAFEAASVLIYFLMITGLSYFILIVNSNVLPSLVPFLGNNFEAQLIIIKPAIVGIGLGLMVPLLKDTMSKGREKEVEK